MSEKNTFKPFIPSEKIMPELTVVSVILGLLLAVVFGAANAYLGLRVGMTISASIPAAVISMGIVRIILRRNSILENNMVQTIGSAGESLAAGAIFTIPTLFMWAAENPEVSAPSFWNITIIALLGGILGVLFMIPLRAALIVEEHGTLPFPEGTACAEVLLAGEEGGEKSKVVFSGLGIAALYKFITDGIKLFPSEIQWNIKSLKTGFGMDVLPALTGVGYICGLKISSYIFAGGILGWFVLIPLITLFGIDNLIAPGTAAISELGPSGIWSSYIRYIGAGAVAAGGIISLVKSLPMIIKTFSKAIKGLGKGNTGNTTLRTERDLPMQVVLAGSLVIALIIWILPSIPVNFVGGLLIVVFGFFFATVSSRMVGIVGSSNNPISGMIIATLLISTGILKASGITGYQGMASAICIGTIVSIVSAMAGDTSQDLKTGYIIGATPVKQQIGEILGAVISALAIAGIMYLLNSAWGFGSPELPAPQGTLMKLVVEGVMGGTLPWGLIFCGMGVAVVLEILRLPVLPFAVGLYLPIYLSTPIYIGGIIRWITEKFFFKDNPEKNRLCVDKGVLYCSGMIAGEGIIGILLAVFAVIPFKGGSLLSFIDLGIPLGNWGSILFFIIIIASIFFFSIKQKNKNSQ
ncbi:MAG: oligopeptide transporter, OPT family [Spirochaetes bacterium]|uniref:Oligopeptide transporter, OPT family n=1 Tax=Candidatus Gallitreponema excrementavium TaxID=2840840 RepID=A0A9D9HQ15_9SPIR|nr:oligopeptide transporter, OPT family [Candidatus Gallitreponema excrementavium]